MKNLEANKPALIALTSIFVLGLAVVAVNVGKAQGIFSSAAGRQNRYSAENVAAQVGIAKLEENLNMLREMEQRQFSAQEMSELAQRIRTNQRVTESALNQAMAKKQNMGELSYQYRNVCREQVNILNRMSTTVPASVREQVRQALQYSQEGLDKAQSMMMRKGNN